MLPSPWSTQTSANCSPPADSPVCKRPRSLPRASAPRQPRDTRAKRTSVANVRAADMLTGGRGAGWGWWLHDARQHAGQSGVIRIDSMLFARSAACVRAAYAEGLGCTARLFGSSGYDGGVFLSSLQARSVWMCGMTNGEGAGADCGARGPGCHPRAWPGSVPWLCCHHPPQRTALASGFLSACSDASVTPVSP